MRQTTSPLNDAETPMQGVRLLLGTIVASQAAMLAIILRASGNSETGPLLAALVWPWLAASAMLGASYLAWRLAHEAHQAPPSPRLFQSRCR
ncbi:MAG: hypothetical protein QOG89_3331, partial [Thermomicrobiales bacterium]|nr:hypothetical protein [Thermomicrobiales bacterium]